MKPSFLLWITFTFLATSCSTLMHQRKVYVNVATDADPATLYIVNSDRSYITPVTFDLERSKEDVNLIVDNDSDEVHFVLKSHLSSGFILGNLFNGSGLAGYAVDLTNPKRFTYPENIFVSFAKNTSFNEKKPKRWTPTVKNQVNLKISIPEGNHFYLNKGSGYGSALGFLGISAGVEYFYTNRNSVNMDIGTMTDFLVPFPAPVDYEGGYDQSFATYADLQLGRDFGAFHIDYGVQANRTSYYERETVELYPEYIDTLKYSVRQYNTGIALSGYYTLTNHFQLGFNYYPSAFTWHKGQFDLHYSHLMMFELIFRLRAIRPGKP